MTEDNNNLPPIVVDVVEIAEPARVAEFRVPLSHDYPHVTLLEAIASFFSEDVPAAVRLVSVTIWHEPLAICATVAYCDAD